MWILIALVIGLVLALITVGQMKSALKTVHHKVAASDYVRSDSMNIVERRDVFLYKQVTRIPRPQKNGPAGGGRPTPPPGMRHGRGGRF